jgi:catechol 2,3-dioxygenase-like lactoylglutathione lyase family enzyme
MLNKITHFTVLVKNQDEASRFYTEKLGFQVHTDQPMGTSRWLTITLPIQKDLEIALMLAESPEEKALVGKQAGRHPLFCFEASNCKGDYEALLKKGVQGVQAPKEEAWGTSAMLKDLYGNLIYIVTTAVKNTNKTRSATGGK